VSEEKWKGYEELVSDPSPGDVRESEFNPGDEVVETDNGHHVHHRIRHPDEMVDK